MSLVKIWKKSKGPMLALIASIVPSVLGIWNFDFQKLAPDATLSSQAIYNTRIGLTTWFILIVVFLLACVLIYSIFSIVKENKASKKDIADTLKCIKESVENNYTIHQRNILSPNIEKVMNEEASKGFSLPQGSLAGRLFDIYLNEVSVYCSMLRECVLSCANQPQMEFSSPEFICAFQELLIAHNKRIKNFHNRKIIDLFTSNGSYHAISPVDHFSNQVDVETKLRYKELLSALNIKNLTSCDEIVFQSWEPIVVERPKPHVFVEEE